MVKGLAKLSAGFVEASAKGRELLSGAGSDDAILRSLTSEVVSIVGPGIQNDRDAARLEELKKQIVLRREVLAQAERLEGSLQNQGAAQADITGELADAETATKALAKLEKARIAVLSDLVDMQRDGAEFAAEAAVQAQAMADALALFPDKPILISDVFVAEGVGGLEDVSKTIQDSVVPGIGDIEAATEKAAEAQRQYNEALAAANNLAQLLGGTIGSIVGQTLAAGAALQNLGSSGGLLGGLKGAFSSGKGGAGGIVGLLGGVSGVLATAGPLIGIGVKIGGFLVKGIKSLFGGPDIARDVARDLGANISKELAASIEASGRPAQLALASIFGEGNLSVGRLAEEAGDLFSFFERGEISKPELITALEEAIPLLLANLNALGPAGEAQLARITAPAESMGVELADREAA